MTKDNQVIPDLTGQGWDWFDSANEPLKTKREEQTGMTQDDYVAHFRAAFSGKSGEIVLSYLASFVQQMPGFDPRMANSADMVAMNGVYRQGMQDLVQHLYAMAQAQPRAKGK